MGRINVTSLIFEGLSEPQQYSLEGAGGMRLDAPVCVCDVNLYCCVLYKKKSNFARGHIRPHDFQATSLAHAFGMVEKGCWAFRGNFVFERSPPAAPEKQQPVWWMCSCYHCKLSTVNLPG